MQIEIASPVSFDKLAVTGNITLPSGSIVSSGTLQLSLTGGYVPHGNQSFDILDFGSISGHFDSVLLPTLGGTLAWDTSQLYMTGVLSVTGPASLAGDYNNDGKVDAADYVVWRNGLGATYTQDNYNIWRANFGRTSGSGTSGISEAVGRADGAVPEPTSAWLGGTCLGAWVLLGAARSRKQHSAATRLLMMK
jgi:hypothetical protein